MVFQGGLRCDAKMTVAVTIIKFCSVLETLARAVPYRDIIPRTISSALLNHCLWQLQAFQM